jgi:hypothetical protein
VADGSVNHPSQFIAERRRAVFAQPALCLFG